MESQSIPPVQIDELEKKIDLIYTSVEKTRSYMKWTMIATIVFFVLPLIALLFIVPSFISSYSQTINELGL